MIERIAADVLVALHLGFILFVGLGALLCLRWRWVAWLQLPAVVWAAAIEFRRGICPLTPLEQSLRRAAGEAGYSGSFIEHYLVPVIYPAQLDAAMQDVFGTLAIAINLVAYYWVVRIRNRRTRGALQSQPRAVGLPQNGGDGDAPHSKKGRGT